MNFTLACVKQINANVLGFLNLSDTKKKLLGKILVKRWRNKEKNYFHGNFKKYSYNNM